MPFDIHLRIFNWSDLCLGSIILYVKCLFDVSIAYFFSWFPLFLWHTFAKEILEVLGITNTNLGFESLAMILFLTRKRMSPASKWRLSGGSYPLGGSETIDWCDGLVASWFLRKNCSLLFKRGDFYGNWSTFLGYMWNAFIDNRFKFKWCTKYKRILWVKHLNFTLPDCRFSPKFLYLYLSFYSNLQTLTMAATNVHANPSQTTD